ncbi:MAG: Restriction endonuclease subunit [Microbacterium sp.]|nr:Restriction endonuclease subunit [Microbacterium sp.]
MSTRFGDILDFAIGGGWGKENQAPGTIPVRVIRGADFPAALQRNISSAPLRFELEGKAAKRILRDGDILLEVSGGTKDRPTGRTIYVSDALLSSVSEDSIPASFCRLVRVDRSKASPWYVFYALQDLYERGGTWEFQNQSTGISNFQFELFCNRWQIDLPPVAEQWASAEVLGALDEKIAANTALAASLSSAARWEMAGSLRDGHVVVTIAEAATLVARGISPQYVEPNEGTRVLNQKCIRDQSVNLEPSRWTSPPRVRPEKLLRRDDVLVNSTGQGTLGRVARWSSTETATVDSHITIVRPNPMVSPTSVIGQAILAIEADIEALGEGSTGQTELSRIQLGQAQVRLPNADKAQSLGLAIDALVDRADAAREENRTLAATRDALLPQLMSGKLRVRDAEAIAADASV